MSGRPYRRAESGFETAELGPLTLADDAVLFSLLLNHPDVLVEDVVFFADGRVVPESDPAWRTVLGWHRRGGPIVLGLTTGDAAPELLVEALRLADVVGDWTTEQWDETLLEYWGSVEEALLAAVAERWDLPRDEGWSLEAWTRVVLDQTPTPGRPVVGVLGTAVSEPMRRAVDWLAGGGREIAAFEARRTVAREAPTYWTYRVAGAWYRPISAAEGPDRRRETFVRRTGSVTAGLLAALEARCVAANCAVAWSGEDWVRFDGRSRSLRVFPGEAWVDLQLVGADEGTLAGLRYRYGVPTQLKPPADAPPEVHLRLSASHDFGPEVELLVSAWVSGWPVEDQSPMPRARVVSRDIEITTADVSQERDPEVHSD